MNITSSTLNTIVVFYGYPQPIHYIFMLTGFLLAVINYYQLKEF
jgi:hypothetical protein